MDYIIREISLEVYSLLEIFLYEAIFLPEGITAPPESTIKQPELQVYLTDYGKKKDDIGLVAEVDTKVVGAVWIADGTIDIPAALMMSAGYVMLAGTLGYDWRLCSA